MPTDRRSPAPRRAQDRLDDHAAIDHLADDLLPALVAKLGASGLGELEIREGSWRVRLRMPADGNAPAGRRPVPGRGASRAGDGPHAERARADAPGAAATGSVAGAPPAATDAAPAVGPSRLVATSPAVGYFRPRGDLRAGTKVRAGDRIGSVDVLGIGQDVVAPGDGLIGATLVEPGEPVEYGQAVIVLEQLSDRRPQSASAAVPDGTPTAEATEAGGGTAELGSGTAEPDPALPRGPGAAAVGLAAAGHTAPVDATNAGPDGPTALDAEPPAGAEAAPDDLDPAPPTATA